MTQHMYWKFVTIASSSKHHFKHFELTEENIAYIKKEMDVSTEEKGIEYSSEWVKSHWLKGIIVSMKGLSDWRTNPETWQKQFDDEIVREFDELNTDEQGYLIRTERTGDHKSHDSLIWRKANSLLSIDIQ